MDSTIFRYEQLKDLSTEIRLVILEPAESGYDEIKCRLEIIDIDDAVYEALSYSWGNAVTRVPISLNNQRFDVTPNLEGALRSLRRQSNDPSHIRKMWIDAICIDQHNNVERNSQVQRMNSIYMSANQVVIWLGKYHEPEDELVKFDINVWGFDHLEPSSFKTAQDAFQLALALHDEYNYKSREWKLEATAKITLDARCWGYLSLLFRRSWFRRLWVLQEVWLARTAVVICERVETTWEIIKGSAQTITTYIALPNKEPVGKLPFLHGVETRYVANVSMIGVERTNVLALIQETCTSKATDPRDRLYALKGLLQGDAIDIDVDYSKTTVDVYRDWAKNHILRNRNLNVLSLCLDSRGASFHAPEMYEGKTLPSWVPDLQQLIGPDRLFEVSNKIPRPHFQYAAGGVVPCRSLENSNQNILSLYGLLVGKVTKTISSEYRSKMPHSSTELQIAISSLENQLSEQFGMSFQEEDPLYSAFVDTLFKGCRYSDERVRDVPSRILYHAWRGSASIPDDYEPFLPEEERKRAYFFKFELILGLGIHRAEFIVTQNDSIGVVSWDCNIREGDEIWVFPGGSTPFVLQRLDQEGFYQLHGPCYVHGYMDGQAISAWRMGNLELELVNIV